MGWPSRSGAIETHHLCLCRLGYSPSRMGWPSRSGAIETATSKTSVLHLLSWMGWPSRSGAIETNPSAPPVAALPMDGLAFTQRCD